MHLYLEHTLLGEDPLAPVQHTCLLATRSKYAIASLAHARLAPMQKREAPLLGSAAAPIPTPAPVASSATPHPPADESSDKEADNGADCGGALSPARSLMSPMSPMSLCSNTG